MMQPVLTSFRNAAPSKLLLKEVSNRCLVFHMLSPSPVQMQIPASKQEGFWPAFGPTMFPRAGYWVWTNKRCFLVQSATSKSNNCLQSERAHEARRRGTCMPSGQHHVRKLMPPPGSAENEGASEAKAGKV